MTYTSPEIMDYYDSEVAKLIAEKYGLSQMSALRKYLQSKTFDMMADAALEMWQFGPAAIFDMWEVEQISGDPRQSVYLRSEACD